MMITLRLNPNFRYINISVSIFLGILGVLTCLFCAGAIFDLPFFINGLGLFLSDAFGLFSFFVPAFLIAAALILADPAFRPERILALAASPLPFITLVAGLKFFPNWVIPAIIPELLGIIIAMNYVAERFRTTESTEVSDTVEELSLTKDTEDTKISEMVEDVVKPHEPINAEYGNFVTANHLTHVCVDHANNMTAGARHPIATKSIKETKEELIETPPLRAFAPLREVPKEAAPTIEYISTPPEHPVKLPAKAKGPYSVPVEGILNSYPDGQYWIIDQQTRDSAETLRQTLEEFNIQAEVTGIRKGPVITMFEILPAPGVKLSKITNLADNIALRLAAQTVRIVAPIPGKHAVGIEVPNKKRNIVSFREIMESEISKSLAGEGLNMAIPIILGKGITGEAVTIDLAQTPHLLIAGATGSGKSVLVNTLILSILYQKRPDECKLIMIDPKIVELKLYNDIPHLLTPVITEPKRAFQALQYCIYEMERRYSCLDSMGVRDIKTYNKRIKEKKGTKDQLAAELMPYMVIIIDEFADLIATSGKELESTVARLAAMSRAVGVHLVLATQRPSINVITGLIKANIPSRIAFMVASGMDSRIIIDQVGAEKLLGKGDMLYSGVVDPFPIRMQGAFVSEEEVERVVGYVKTLGEPDYIDEEIFIAEDEDDGIDNESLFDGSDDPLYEKALEVVVQQGKASASYLQRKLKLGYNRAARIVEEMEHRGIVGPAQGSKPRELLHVPG
ncbi:MAG: DNA translocase FtsK [Spirochaetaceae bacterium]|jgi:S-DNA-T family DNA segregation ATPase FtsK/SpoIIIE|nr:DNA translocase FtsK [Spirochaetaceae bacterium]